LFPEVIALLTNEEPSPSLRFDLVRKLKADFQMAKVLTEDRLSRPGSGPLKVAIAVAVLGVLIVDHGPWNKPKVQPAFVASYSSTGEAGAKVMPTEPKLQVEPEPPMPKPVHPVNPAPQ
jgi:hypothetical protein